MSKGKRNRRKRKPQGHPARQARLRAVEDSGTTDLHRRREYQANMQAWRDAGCPPAP